MPNVGDIQDAIIEHLEDNFVQKIVEQSIPDGQTVLRNERGVIEPYIAIQFGDIQQGRSRSMVGPRGDDYVLPLYAQCIAPNVGIARRLQNKLLDVLLGEDFPFSGCIRKRPGGGMYSLNNSNSATEAIMFPASFGVTVQFD